jgi:hypothetical protein
MRLTVLTEEGALARLLACLTLDSRALVGLFTRQPQGLE